MGLRRRSYAMMDAKEWYAVYTRPRWEKKVFAGLQEQGLTAYCPLNKVVRQWSDRKKTVELPLFTSYVFVQIGPEEQTRVRMVPGVVNFVYWMGKPARIREDEMETIRSFVTSHGNIRLARADYGPGDTFEIEEGLMKGQQAVVRAVRNNKLELIIKSMNIKLVVDKAPASQAGRAS